MSFDVAHPPLLWRRSAEIAVRHRAPRAELAQSREGASHQYESAVQLANELLERATDEDFARLWAAVARSRS